MYELEKISSTLTININAWGVLGQEAFFFAGSFLLTKYFSSPEIKCKEKKKSKPMLKLLEITIWIFKFS